MSPEQARGSKTVDHRSDLWALAVVVYRCMTGQFPFMSDALGDLFAKIISDPIPVPSAVAPVPPGFDAWWARAAARDPAQRFQSAKEMTDALGLALGVTVPFGGDVAAHVETRPPVSPKDGTTLISPGGPTPSPYATTMPEQATGAPYSTSMPGASIAPPRSRAPVVLGLLAAAVLGGGGVYAVVHARGTPADQPQPHATPPASSTGSTAVATATGASSAAPSVTPAAPAPSSALASPPAESAAPAASAQGPQRVAIPHPTAVATAKPTGSPAAKRRFEVDF
jgi:serine/threonine-protein kinase